MYIKGSCHVDQHIDACPALRDSQGWHLARLRESAGTMSAGSGGLPANQCRKPQRVSTQWQSIHRPDPDTQRAISPCLQPPHRSLTHHQRGQHVSIPSMIEMWDPCRQLNNPDALHSRRIKKQVSTKLHMTVAKAAEGGVVPGHGI